MGMARKLGRLWRHLWSTYWFLPATMVVGAGALSFLLPYLDTLAGGNAHVVPGWVYEGGPEGARVVLSTIAGSMITVAALTFSITIAGLSTASAQFGPRLLSNFIRDRGYQFVLGTFLAAFVYCLLVLRTIQSTESKQFVPYFSLAVGIFFAIAGVGVLVYFIHHAAFSIRAESIVASTGKELRKAIDHLFPAEVDGIAEDRAAARSLPEGFPTGARDIPAPQSGYIQAADQGRLARLADDHDVVLKLDHRPGRFITAEETLLQSWPDTALDQSFLEDAYDCFELGAQRPLTQDVESAVDQLVEIALRALSPGINDPDTALACIDQLADAVTRVEGRNVPPALIRCDGRVRLVTYPLTYARLVDASFSRIRQYGRGCVPVLLRLLEVIAALGHQVEVEAHRDALLRQARMIKRASDESVPEPEDRTVINARFRAAVRVLTAPRAASAAYPPEAW